MVWIFAYSMRNDKWRVEAIPSATAAEWGVPHYQTQPDAVSALEKALTHVR